MCTPPLTLSLSLKTPSPLLKSNLSKSGTLSQAPTLVHMLHSIPSLCKQGKTLCVSSSHLVSSSQDTLSSCSSHNLSKSGTLSQAPTLVHRLQASQVYGYKVRPWCVVLLSPCLFLSRHLLPCSSRISPSLEHSPKLQHLCIGSKHPKSVDTR